MFAEPIPPEIGLLTKLEILHLNENSLTGPIPEELGELSESLYDLQLQVNKLTGTVPDFLCDMELKDLKLSFNYLSGTMPTCFSTGRIANHKNPSTYALAYEKKTWTGLRYLHLSANDLTGEWNIAIDSCFRSLRQHCVGCWFFVCVPHRCVS